MINLDKNGDDVSLSTRLVKAASAASLSPGLLAQAPRLRLRLRLHQRHYFLLMMVPR